MQYAHLKYACTEAETSTNMTPMAKGDSLPEVAKQLAAKGKGILASDESTGTIGKRLEKAGLCNTEERSPPTQVAPRTSTIIH